MSIKRQMSEERIAAKQQELDLWAKEPPCNPWQYSQAKSSYPRDSIHIDYRDPRQDRYTRLHLAVRANDLARVRSLLEQGANPWVKDRKGRLPITHAVLREYFEIDDFLRERMDAMLDECSKYERETGKKLGLRSQRRKATER